MVMGTIEYWQTLRTLHQPRVFQKPSSPAYHGLYHVAHGPVSFPEHHIQVL